VVTASACGVALTGAGVLDDQPPAAFEAEDRAFELVVVDTGAFSVAPCGEDVLHGRPGHRVDQWLMSSRMLDALNTTTPL